jgi:hypothetical protein
VISKVGRHTGHLSAVLAMIFGPTELPWLVRKQMQAKYYYKAVEIDLMRLPGDIFLSLKRQIRTSKRR